MWTVTIIFFLSGSNKLFWTGLIIFWCLMLSTYYYFRSDWIFLSVWLFNAWIWKGTYKRIKINRKILEEWEKINNNE